MSVARQSRPTPPGWVGCRAFFANDRIGIAVIWSFAALCIPLIREVVVVEAYYAFRIRQRVSSSPARPSASSATTRIGGSRHRVQDQPEARSLRFAGLRGMIASIQHGSSSW